MPQFGNWSVDSDGIRWLGKPEYLLEKDVLTDNGTDERANTYDFLVHMAQKTSLTRSDLNDLNEAFVEALDYYNQTHNPKVSWEATLETQQIEFHKR